MARRERPSKFTAAIGAEICERLGNGEPLAVICRDAHMAHDSTVRRWADGDEAFALAIADARARGFDIIAAQCLEIANTPVEGVETVEKADGAVETRTGDMLGHRKLQIETRLKLLAKWDPKRYGDKQQIEHSASVPEELAAWLNSRA